MFLDCNGFAKHPQADCRTYTPDGKLTYANRYAIKSLSFDKIEIADLFDNTSMFSDFVKIVNSQNNYNHGGKINAIPLITFHNVGVTTNQTYYTNAGMFDKFMKYIHDNDFKVLTLKQIGYDTNNNIFHIKNSSETRIVSITNDTITSSNISNTIHKTPLCNLLTKLDLGAFQGKITERNDPQISSRQISSEGDQSQKISLLNLSGSNTYLIGTT